MRINRIRYWDEAEIEERERERMSSQHEREGGVMETEKAGEDRMRRSAAKHRYTLRVSHESA
jgi:hypothetical protein